MPSTTVMSKGGNVQMAWTRDRVAALSREEALALFRTLKAPMPDEMNGEFDGLVPEYIREEWLAFVTDSGNGQWLGKAYRPEVFERWPGHGYNIFETCDGVTRQMNFAWAIAPSTFDGAPSLIMYYSAFRHWAGENDLVDEIRKIDDGLYLGVYHTRVAVPRFTPRQGASRSEPEVFILAGPVRGWVGAQPHEG